MIKTLRESKAKLSELVDRAGRGEDVLISVRGRVKVRLTRATAPETVVERTAWLRELRRIQKSLSNPASCRTVEEILAESREDRA